jgi:L-ascorbate metabolism protein UlaG (beta-lactamase superfamily)
MQSRTADDAGECMQGVVDGFKVFASAAFAAVLALSFGVRAQQPNTSAPAWNDNSLIAIQKQGGDPTRPGDVKIEFYGHDAFKITSPQGLTVLTDPWRNDPTGAYPKWFLTDFPAISVDIVLSTHAHFDHDAVERPNGLVVLERLVGQYRLGDVEVTGLADKHKCEPPPAGSTDPHAEACPPNNPIDLDNAIQIIETGGLRIAVWGDNRAVPDPAFDRYLKNVDVLILPIEAVLTREEADAILRKYDPKAVIPSHYFVKGLTNEGSGVESAERWVQEQEKAHVDVVRLDRPELTLSPASLKSAHRRVYYFGDKFEKK